MGMVVGSFTSVSLAPPLVAFMPDRSSSSWPRIEKAGRFCVNILAANQLDICRAIAAKGENKFASVNYRLAEEGLPVIEGVAAWIACHLEAVHEAGDHFIVTGRVDALAVEGATPPLLFYRGAYGSFNPLSSDRAPEA